MIVPKTITSHVMSIDALKALTYAAMHESNASELDQGAKFQQSSCISENESSIVLAGLHACGDLSVMMLKCVLCTNYDLVFVFPILCTRKTMHPYDLILGLGCQNTLRDCLLEVF